MQIWLEAAGLAGAGMLAGAMNALAGGGTCICMDRADAVGIAEWIGREKIEVFTGAPATIFDLITRPIEIGDGCWIAAQAFVGPGAVVPPGTMVKAGEVWKNR